MLVTKKASLLTATSLCLWIVCHVGLRWIYLFCLCDSLLDATEDPAELLRFDCTSLVDDSRHGFVSLPQLPAWPRLPADSWCRRDND